jgi:hypothetical protein
MVDYDWIANERRRIGQPVDTPHHDARRNACSGGRPGIGRYRPSWRQTDMMSEDAKFALAY